jgi:glycosidase
MEKFKQIVPIKYIIAKNLNLNLADYDEEGRLLINHPYFARLLAFKIEKSLSLKVLPGKVNSLAILDGLFDFLMEKFDDEFSPGSLTSAVDFLKEKVSSYELELFIRTFIQDFPTKEILTNQKSIEIISELLFERHFRESLIKNLILVYLTNQNKAAYDLKILFDDKDLIENSDYLHLLKLIELYFDRIRIEQLKYKSLLEFLSEPIRVSPENIEGQLNFIKENWRNILPDELINQILKAFDLIKEDSKIFQVGFGKGETKVPTFSLEELLGFGDKFSGSLHPVTPLEVERFTPDTDWMPKVVLLAKNTYVWLYQLSKKYNQEIKRLDQIPDAELDLLASYNFNALWLIGIWERSPASRKIKQLSGNPEALASAYSIYDYVIASDLGGEEAYQNLNERCLSRGIRLACDIVPNHMGIYSRWIIEHSDYFIQTDYPPFPSYSFTGPNLSDHPDFQIRIEDKYWTRQDAAVVFQLIENKTGKIRYIYHGNDGTNMPWNDTAQLNLLKPEVREVLIQLIFSIARKFSIIRLDAAMTLTQKHYQRLWFPAPGTGGSIPSRTDFAMTTDEFLKHYPKEFWREVIDRINVEKPDTLLLAEAFWLMEGYFVRTLGMHRVYNSAFMNMLKNEENEKYRDLVTNTLEFNPEILKRYVNFLSNPDEETAINQFGDGDKYFGCLVMMVTMPGLPMFAHGQIQGFREKYGHEYYRPYYDEMPNEFLIERHKREIFPLMKKRYLFSQVINFEFYDFKNPDGYVIENVFAYSNRSDNEAALIFYNNSYNAYYGFIDFSCPKNYGSSESESDKKLISKSLGEALGIKNSDNHFYLFRESKSNLEYLKRGSEFYKDKFFVELRGYEYKLFLDFVEIYDSTGELNSFYQLISRNGVFSISDELIKLHLSKVVTQTNEILNSEKLKILLSDAEKDNDKNYLIEQLRSLIQTLSLELKFDKTKLELILFNSIKSIQLINQYFESLRKKKSNPKWLINLSKRTFDSQYLNSILSEVFISVFISGVRKLSQIEQKRKEIFTNEVLTQLTTDFDSNQIKFLEYLLDKVNQSGIFDEDKELELDSDDLNQVLLECLNDNEVQKYLEVNEYENEIYFKKEKFENLLRIISILILINKIKLYTNKVMVKKIQINKIQKMLKSISDFINEQTKLMLESGFRFRIVLEKIKDFEVKSN